MRILVTHLNASLLRFKPSKPTPRVWGCSRRAGPGTESAARRSVPAEGDSPGPALPIFAFASFSMMRLLADPKRIRLFFLTMAALDSRP
jgi:hypothetical protein